MKLILATLTFFGLISVAQATCFGSGNFHTCNDNDGNTYNVNHFGNTTMVQGSNLRTGSQWSETANTMGNTTMYNGQTNGQNWNMTEQNFGGMRTYSGVNANGQMFNHTCTQFGCR